MRTVGLLVLATLLPVIAYAAPVNINTADATLLDSLPGIGPSKATAIVDYRTQNGPFATIADIQNVSGIGPSTFANIETLITVGTVADALSIKPVPKPVSPIPTPTPTPTPKTPPPPQPSVSATSYEKVQAAESPAVSRVEPITNPTKNIQDNEEAVDAPAVATELAAVGAALLPEPPGNPSRVSGIFKSPWTLGLLGVIVLAGGAFILL